LFWGTPAAFATVTALLSFLPLEGVDSKEVGLGVDSTLELTGLESVP
jgi:hypothetical protein